MAKSLLVTRPKYDDGTEYLSAYALEVIKEAKSLEINVKDLEKTDANKKEVEKFITNKNPEIVFFNGHGSEEEICGHGGETLISDSNVSLVILKKIYFLNVLYFFGNLKT
mgnify:CR=1 FL=1